LFHTTQFSPYLASGALNWQSIVVLIFFVTNILINTTSIIYISISRAFLKKGVSKKLIYQSLKIGGVLSLGLTMVVVLNFLHILNIYYGFGVLTLVLLIALVI